MESQIFYMDDMNWTEFDNFSYGDIDYTSLPTSVCNTSYYMNNLAEGGIYLILGLLSLFGNGVVLLAFSKQKLNNSTASDVFMSFLSMVCMFQVLVLWGTALIMIWPGTFISVFMCKLLTFSDEMFFFLSMYIVTFLSLNRWYAICRPLNTYVQSVTYGVKICILFTVIAACMAIPNTIFMDVLVSKGDGLPRCHENLGIETTMVKLWMRLVILLLGFILPFLIMVTFYGMAARRLCSVTTGARNRAMKIIFLVVLVFIFCWSPHVIVNIVDLVTRLKWLEETCTSRQLVTQFIGWTWILGMFHTCMNPCLYALVGNKIRNQIIGLFRSRLSSQSSGGSYSL